MSIFFLIVSNGTSAKKKASSNKFKMKLLIILLTITTTYFITYMYQICTLFSLILNLSLWVTFDLISCSLRFLLGQIVFNWNKILITIWKWFHFSFIWLFSQFISYSKPSPFSLSYPLILHSHSISWPYLLAIKCKLFLSCDLFY